MPRKSKVTAVPVSEHPEEGLARAWGDNEGKTDAEQMTDIINVVSVSKEPDDALPEAPLVEAEAPVAPKAKASRAPKKAPVSVEPEVDVTIPTQEDEAKTVLTQQVTDQREAKTEAKTEAKSESKVSCPDCGKQMSAKTLKYSHVPNCVAKKQNDALPKAPPSQARQRESVMEEVIENEVQKRLQNRRSERAARREEMVQKLMQNAF